MIDDHTKAIHLAYLKERSVDEYDLARLFFELQDITTLEEAKAQAIPMCPKELEIVFSRERPVLPQFEPAP